MSKNGSQTKKWHFAKVGAHLKNRREKGGLGSKLSLNNEKGHFQLLFKTNFKSYTYI
jgi:hypothetical protein